MRKLILSIMAAITLPALALGQAPDAKAKAEQILKQARAAIGDEKKLKDLQGLSITGTARMGAGDRQMESELEIDMLLPDKIKKTTTNQIITQTNALNGDQIWDESIRGMGGEDVSVGSVERQTGRVAHMDGLPEPGQRRSPMAHRQGHQNVPLCRRGHR